MPLTKCSSIKKGLCLCNCFIDEANKIPTEGAECSAHCGSVQSGVSEGSAIFSPCVS